MTPQRDLDQFYTKPEVASNCVKRALKIIPVENRQIFFEPSAGSGSFMKPLINHQIIGIDIDPKSENIIKADFLSFGKEDLNLPKSENITVIGNPPFGNCSRQAIRFFNKASTMASFIAFIVPKTFRKISVHNKLNLNFHLIYDQEIPSQSFIMNGDSYDVPCCFQIWKRDLSNKRKIIVPPKNKWIDFVKKENAEFAIRRVGGRAGKILNGTDYNTNTTYFCKELIPGTKEIIQKIDFSDIVNNTAGVRSLSKTELITTLSKKLNVHHAEAHI